MPQTDDPIFCKAINNLLVVNASQELLNRQVEMMTFNYSHEMDDYEAMLIDAKNDARTAVREEVRAEVRAEDFKVFESLGVSKEILEKARRIVEVQNE